ncbi:MAG: YraN family protein [Phycisphaerales bacterium]
MRLLRKKSVWHRGEDAAARHMKRSGCSIIARNLRLPMGEIDLLCREKATGTIVIVEVKARVYSEHSRVRTDPTANITHKKRAKLRTLARALMQRPDMRGRSIRIDVVAVRFSPEQRRPIEIRHYRSAVSDR